LRQPLRSPSKLPRTEHENRRGHDEEHARDDADDSKSRLVNNWCWRWQWLGSAMFPGPAAHNVCFT